MYDPGSRGMDWILFSNMVGIVVTVFDRVKKRIGIDARKLIRLLAGANRARISA
jgi:hypothetical protein